MNIEKRDQLHDTLRATTPVYHALEQDCFYLTRYADVRGLLLDDHFKNPDAADPAPAFVSTLSNALRRPHARREIGSMDDPDHGRIRGRIHHAFRRRVADARPAIEALARDTIEAMSFKTDIDLVRDFASVVTLKSISQIVGVDPADLPQYRQWSQAILGFFREGRTLEEDAAMDAANEGFSRHIAQIIAERRRSPRDDLITDLVQPTDGGEISDAEICDNVVGLLVTGAITTTDLIATTALLLIKHPIELEKLRKNPALVDAVVEEALRLETPIETEWRIAARDLEIGGCPVGRGKVVAVSLSGANHDPMVFEDPHSFNVTRRPSPVLSFGAGAHVCLGAPLARLQARVAIATLFKRFPELHLLSPDSAPDWREGAMFRSLATLKVRAPLVTDVSAQALATDRGCGQEASSVS